MDLRDLERVSFEGEFSAGSGSSSTPANAISPRGDDIVIGADVSDVYHEFPRRVWQFSSAVFLYSLYDAFRKRELFPVPQSAVRDALSRFFCESKAHIPRGTVAHLISTSPSVLDDLSSTVLMMYIYGVADSGAIGDVNGAIIDLFSKVYSAEFVDDASDFPEQYLVGVLSRKIVSLHKGSDARAVVGYSQDDPRFGVAVLVDKSQSEKWVSFLSRYHVRVRRYPLNDWIDFADTRAFPGFFWLPFSRIFFNNRVPVRVFPVGKRLFLFELEPVSEKEDLRYHYDSFALRWLTYLVNPLFEWLWRIYFREYSQSMFLDFLRWAGASFLYETSSLYSMYGAFAVKRYTYLKQWHQRYLEFPKLAARWARDVL